MKNSSWAIILSLLPFVSLFSQTMTITAVTPDTVVQGQTLQVAVTGQQTDFAQGSTTSWLERDGVKIIPTNRSVQNATLINSDYNIPSNAAVGYWDVLVTDWHWGLIGLGNGIFIDAFVGVNHSGPAIRESITLYPNPAVDHFQLRYALPNKSQVRILMRDIRGHLIQTLYAGAQAPGEYEFRVDVADLQLPSGIFLACLQVDEMEFAVKVNVAR